MTATELETRLQFVSGASGDADVTITGLRRVPGGASRETWAFDADLHDGRGPRPLILRRDPGPTGVASDRALEFNVLRVAHAAGVPVPEVLWLGDDPAILDGRFFVMERVEGETLARRLLREPTYAEARRAMPRAARCDPGADPRRADRRSVAGASRRQERRGVARGGARPSSSWCSLEPHPDRV